MGSDRTFVELLFLSQCIKLDGANFGRSPAPLKFWIGRPPFFIPAVLGREAVSFANPKSYHIVVTCIATLWLVFGPCSQPWIARDPESNQTRPPCFAARESGAAPARRSRLCQLLGGPLRPPARWPRSRYLSALPRRSAPFLISIKFKLPLFCSDVHGAAPAPPGVVVGAGCAAWLGVAWLHAQLCLFGVLFIFLFFFHYRERASGRASERRLGATRLSAPFLLPLAIFLSRRRRH